jgi:hypothetical protein
MYEQPVTRFLIVDKATKHSPEKVIKSLPNKCPKWWNQSRPDPIIEPMGHNQPAHEKRKKMIIEKNREGAIGNGNRVVAESIVRERKGERLIETIEYYLNELDRLERGTND